MLRLAYSLLADQRSLTRSLSTPGFSRQEAQHLIPKTNPFLRDFFYQVSGPPLDDEPFAGFVDDLVAVLAEADMGSILAEFGRRSGQEDPIMHFYETFLAAYDPRLREARGVYYTPTPVASYIVRSLDHLLRTRFGCPNGLADSTQIEIDDPAPAPPGGKAKAKPGTPEFRAALRDAMETMGRTVFAHGVMNWTKDDHWGYTNETGVMLKVVNGQFVVEK